MHELAITEQMVDLALRHAAGVRARRITDVHVVVGQLSGASSECIRFYWEVLAERTAASGACLHFRETMFEMRCADCGAEFRPDGQSYRCPACGGSAVRVARGNELYVEAIDVEPAAQDAVGAMEADR